MSRARTAGASLVFLLCTACPSSWRKGGAMDQAARKDLEGQLAPDCPEGRHRVQIPNCPADDDDCWVCPNEQ